MREKQKATKSAAYDRGRDDAEEVDKVEVALGLVGVTVGSLRCVPEQPCPKKS